MSRATRGTYRVLLTKKFANLPPVPRNHRKPPNKSLRQLKVTCYPNCRVTQRIARQVFWKRENFSKTPWDLAVVHCPCLRYSPRRPPWAVVPCCVRARCCHLSILAQLPTTLRHPTARRPRRAPPLHRTTPQSSTILPAD